MCLTAGDRTPDQTPLMSVEEHASGEQLASTSQKGPLLSPDAEGIQWPASAMQTSRDGGADSQTFVVLYLKP